MNPFLGLALGCILVGVALITGLSWHRVLRHESAEAYPAWGFLGTLVGAVFWTGVLVAFAHSAWTGWLR